MGDDQRDKQRAILRVKEDNPDMSDEAIAAETDASATEVRETLDRYYDPDRKRDRNILILLIFGLIFLGFFLAGTPGGGSQAGLLVAPLIS